MDELLHFLYDNPDIEAVLLVERAIREEDPYVEGRLRYLRDGNSTIRVVFIRDHTERDYDFELRLYELGVYDVFYPDRYTNINIDAVAIALLQGSIDMSNPPPLPADPNAPPPVKEIKPGLLDKFKGISLPDFKMPSMPEIKLPSLSEFLRKKQTEEDEQPTVSIQDYPSYKAIGIVNCSRGFGATSLTINMANILFGAGHSVAVLAMDLKPDLYCSGLSDAGVTVSVPEGDIPPDWEALAEESEYLIIDFGIVYDFLPSGDYIPAQSSFVNACAVQEALDFCDLRLHLTSNEPWHR
jgi:hypothetical protein